MTSFNPPDEDLELPPEPDTDGPTAEEATPPEPDEETDDGLFSYQVALRINVRAQDEEDAVDQFIEQLTSAGLRKWVYDVYNDETGIEGIQMWTGHGVNVTAEIVAGAEQAAANQSATPPASDDDADLLALAAKLNEE